MKIYLLLLGLWISTAVIAQKPDLTTRFKQKIEQGGKLFAQNHIKEAIQSYNVARVLAGTDNTKHKQVDACIEKVFVAIEKQKQEAITNAQKAKTAEKKAKIATNDAKALYWSSDAGKINPIQGLRLLGEARKKTSDTNSIPIVKEATENLFNKSNEHKWLEKLRYGNGSDINFSSDSKWLVTANINGGSKLWDVSSGKEALFLSSEKGISDINFSSDSKWLVTIKDGGGSKLWDVSSGKSYDFLSSEEGIKYINFSSDSNWLVTIKDEGGSKLWDVSSGKSYDFLSSEKGIYSANFSSDSKWLVTRVIGGGSKLWDVSSGKEASFLSSEKGISDIYFSKDSELISIITGHKVKTFKIGDSKLIQTLWLNKEPRDVNIIDNQLYVTVGKAIIKTDLDKDRGDIMSWGDGEPLDYKYDEIQEWIKVFGDKYLLPLSEEVKKKYGIK